MKELVAVLAVGMFTVLATGADTPQAWPQFRGPNGSGIAEDQKPPVEFGPEKNVKWKVPAPSGLSSPIIAGDKLVVTAFDGGKLYTIAYNRADGKEAWRAEAPAKQIEAYYKPEGSPASSTPATDGKRIVSYFGSCGLLCYDLSGKELWRFEMPPMVMSGDFGTGTSPILADGMVILVRDEMKNPRILAFDAANGSLKWEVKRQSPASYCTPVVWETPSGKQIAAAGHARMTGYDFKTGKEQWSVTEIPSGCCASPVIVGDTLYFAGWSPGGADDKEFQMPTFDDLLSMADTNKDGLISKAEAEKTFLKDFFDSNDTNHDGQISRDEWDATLKFLAEGKNCAFALKAGGSGDITNSHILWKQSKSLPYIPSAIVYDGQCVMVKDGGIVTAVDAKSGKVAYRERAVASGRYQASPVAASGHIYFTSLEDGSVTVLKAGSDKSEVVASNPKLGERVAATPAIADDTLYVRTEKHLYAFAEKK